MRTKIRLLALLALAFSLPIVIVMVACQGGMSQPRPEGPIDIYTAAGVKCVTAHSTTRALSASYNGALYQVKRDSDGRTMDIGVVKSAPDGGGYADAAAQDDFCAGTVCWITTIYDQSGMGNHLYQAPPGTYIGPATGGFNTLSIADMAPISINGHKAYGVFMMPGAGYRNNNATGLAINDEPQGIYDVVDGTHYDSGCCFNYGNTSTNSTAVGRGTMDTVYFGTATAWGSGTGTGPWIMSDMEAGLFSGYNTKVNEGNPTIDSWRFVAGFVTGGGGNEWGIWGGNAQEGALQNFYEGVRPQSNENSNYFPMHRKGSVQLGNGGDNGNGSAGTFYEGVITFGRPTAETLEAVHANILAARYDVEQVRMSRITTFAPESSQEVTATFTNTTDAPVEDVALSISVPSGWTAVVSGTSDASRTFSDTVAPGASVNATFTITSSSRTGAGVASGKAEWKNGVAGKKQSETTAQRVRNVHPVKVNEVRLTGSNSTDQFIELYNAGDTEVDISNWTLMNTKSQWKSVTAATIPAGTKLAGGDYYLFGLSGSGLAAPAGRGDTVINVLSTAGFEAGQAIDIEGETRTITSVGTAATSTTLFVPVSTGPWLTVPAGSTNIPVTNVNGFEVGQKIGIDVGGNYEVVTVSEVGKAATQTTLAVEVTAGDTNIKVAANANMTVGDTLTIGTGGRMELAVITNIGSAGANGTGVDLAAPLKFDQIVAVDVSDKGTGISFSPATRYPHKSGETIQALGSGLTLDRPLEGSHEYGAAIVNAQATTVGYQGNTAPDQWFGYPLSASIGSIALMDADGKAVVDALVYGAQQGNSSADGYVTTPEIATLEGDQGQGGCIMVVPQAGRGGFGGRGGSAASTSDRSVGRFPDGTDTDSNCVDFHLQTVSSLAAEASAGANNIKVASVADFAAGQTITIDNGANIETAVIAVVGTPGASTVSAAAEAGATSLTVASTAGFTIGQTITIGSGANRETAVVAAISGGGRGGFGGFGGFGGRGGASITVTSPLSHTHAEGAQISGSGITLTAPLTRSHESGAQLAGSVPTPGAPNQY